MAVTNERLIWNLSLGYIGEFAVTDSATTTKQYQLCDRFYEQARDEVMMSHLWNEAKKRVIIAENTDKPISGYDRTYTKPTDALKIVSVNDSLGSDQRNNADGVYAWEVEGDLILSNAGEVPQTWATGTTYVDGEFVSATAVNWATGTAYIEDQFVKSGSLVYQVLDDHTSDTIANDIASSDLAAGVTGSTGTYEVVDGHISDTLLNDVASSDIEAVASEARVVFVEYIYQLTDTTKFTPKLKQAIAMKLAIKVITGLTNDTKSKVDLINEFEKLTMPKARSIDSQQQTTRPIFNSEWIRSRQAGI